MAFIIEYKPYSHHPDEQDIFVVLAKTTDGHAEPYVTWLGRRTNNEWTAFISGRYFRKLSDAAKDYEARGFANKGE